MKKYKVQCPMTASLSVLGGKWKILIIWYLHELGPMRYGALKKRLPDSSLKVYNDHLKELVKDGLIKKEIFAEVPPRTEYSLTNYGLTLIPALKLLMDWGLVHLQRNPQITDEVTYRNIMAYFEDKK